MLHLRLPRALIALGFGCIVFWTVAYLIAVLPTGDSATTLVFWLTTTAGYGLAGFACWRWITANGEGQAARSLIRGPTRWMAAAALITGAGVAALTFQIYQDRPPVALVNADLHYGLRLAGFAVGTLGFVLAAAGFWIASNAAAPEPETDQERPSVLEGRR
jgi:hypothetical protein